MTLSPKTFRLAGTLSIVILALGLGGFTLWHQDGMGSGTAPITLLDVANRKPMPDFAFHDAQGSLHHLRDEVGSRPVLVHFWATWCGPCGPEIPVLDRLAAQQGQHLTILPLALDRDAIPKVLEFYARKQIKALPILAPEADAPLPQALPSSILVDADGRIAWSAMGAQAWDSPGMAAVIKSLQ